MRVNADAFRTVLQRAYPPQKVERLTYYVLHLPPLWAANAYAAGWMTKDQMNAAEAWPGDVTDLSDPYYLMLCAGDESEEIRQQRAAWEHYTRHVKPLIERGDRMRKGALP